MRVRVAVMGYRQMADLFRNMRLTSELADQLTVQVYDALFGKTLEIARSLEEQDAVDVFVSGSANAAVIKPHLQTPVVTISVSAFDLMSAVKQASLKGGTVAVVSYLEPIEGLAQVVDLLKPSVIPVTYLDYEDLKEKIAILKERGCRAVVGASLACEIAEYHGLYHVLVYSDESLRMAIKHAVEVAQSRRSELERIERLRTIINFAHEAIMVTDAEGCITLFNPMAEHIMGIPASRVLGQKASAVIPNSRIDQVIRTGQAELNQLQDVGDVRIITNRVPIRSGDELLGVVATFQDVGYIERASEEVRLVRQRKGFKARATFRDITWKSSAMAKVVSAAERFARSDLSVLITGESGTGKELFAQGIHNASSRHNGPFVAVNCASLTESLLESELFGYEEGSFTGARRGGKEGLFELAHRGTIFLDEIGDISAGLQSRLLRAIQEREILRVGGTRVVTVDVRVIASTNKNLWHLVQSGRFRDDLYFRLNVLSLRVPPLRDRPEDIPLLVHRFLSSRTGANRQLLENTRINAISKALSKHDWPGNVRELENAVARLVVDLEGKAPPPLELETYVASLLEATLLDRQIYCSSPQRGLQDQCGGPLHDMSNAGNADNSNEPVRAQSPGGLRFGRLSPKEKAALVSQALSATGGRVGEAARFLGIGRSSLWRYLKTAGNEGAPRTP